MTVTDNEIELYKSACAAGGLNNALSWTIHGASLPLSISGGVSQLNI